MVSPHLEKVFFNQILASKDYISYVTPRFFQTEPIRVAYELAKEFYQKYNVAPTENQLIELTRAKGLDEQLTPEKVRIIYNVDLATYENTWLTENLETWVEYKNLDTSVFDLIQYMKTTQVNAENIKDVVQTAKSIISDRNNVDFKFDEGLDFFKATSHEQLLSDTFPTGYPYFDLVTGGYSLKTLWVLMGAAKVGKCVTNLVTLNIKSKKTGEIRKVSIGEFHEMVKTSFENNK